MKVLIDHSQPFALAHGGVQLQIERTVAALGTIGLEAEFVRWWDPDQQGDLLHLFGATRLDLIQASTARKRPVVLTSFFSETCNRPQWKLWAQGLAVRALLALPGGEGVRRQLVWPTYRACAQNIVGLEAEARVLRKVYGVPQPLISVVPLGVSPVFLGPHATRPEGPHLISVGTITDVKRSLELAHLAVAARVPILFVGKPFDPGSSYWREFQSLVDDQWVKYRPHVGKEDELLGLLRQARGFVLYSRFENWCLAAHEAAASGLPLLVPEARWSRERFGNEARYFAGTAEANRGILRRFFEEAPRLKPPAVRLSSWEAVARRLQSVYEAVLAREHPSAPAGG